MSSEGPARRLLGDLLDRGIQVGRRGRDLTFRGPRNAWSAGLRSTVAARKPELLELVGLGRKWAPAAIAQEGLWLLDRLGSDAAFNMPDAVLLEGPLDVAALEAALTALVRRHEVLRTSFLELGGRPYQVITPLRERSLPVVDLRGLGSARAECEARRLADREAVRPFDLSCSSLLRAFVVILDGSPTRPRRSAFVRNLHHIVSDGWSEGVFQHELAMLYSAFGGFKEGGLPALSLQYADFAVRQRRRFQGPLLEERLAFWRRYLADPPPAFELPADRPRRHPRPRRGRLLLRRIEVGGLEALGREVGSSLFMSALAAFLVVMSRAADRRDLVLGTAVAGRDRRELEDLIGFFVNTLALYFRLGESTFRDLLTEVRESILDTFAHQDLPFEFLKSALRGAGNEPFFRVVFQLHADPAALPDLGGIVAERLPLAVPPAKFDLAVNLTTSSEASRLDSSWHYDPDLFDASTIERLAGHFANLVAGLGDGRRALVYLPLLAAAEEHQLTAEWTTRNVEPAVPAAPVHELFRHHAEQAGDAIALVFRQREWTYAELRRRANRLSHALLAAGAGRGRRVALVLGRCDDAVLAILATLGAGAAYVPVDPASPPERIAFILADARPDVIVSMERYRHLLAAGVPALFLDADAELLERQSPADPGVAVAGGDPAYVIYTSGSTGRPKGVVVPHHNMTRLIAAGREHFDFSSRDVWTLFHSYAFDFSVWEIWGALALGGRLVVVSFRTSRSPAAFHELVACQGVTVLNQTPSAFRLFIDADRRGGLVKSLRYVIFGGEALSFAGLAPWIERYSDRDPELINMYGITETTVHVTWMRLGEADVRTAGVKHPIGRPLPCWRVHLADRVLHPVPIGTAGEMCVGGWGVAGGYHDRPALTAERFVPDPWSEKPGARLYKSGDLGRHLADGQLDYLGRIDLQVQIRGFRVELGEIEVHLDRHPAVDQAVVLVRHETGETVLVAYVVPSGEARGGAVNPPGLGELRGFLSRVLPEHMLPAAVVHLDELPLTVNGKVDRKALPAPDTERPEIAAAFVQPQSALERFLARLWSDTLKTSRIGLDDDFFELGGDSVRGAVLINALQRELGEIVHVITVFDYPTIRAMASYLREQYDAALTRLGLGGDADAVATAPVTRPVDEESVARFTASIAPLVFARQATVRKNPPAIFILAPPRSGTTLLRIMLGGHPRLFAPPELELLSFTTMGERKESFSGRFAFWRQGLVRAVMELEAIDAPAAEEIIAAFETADRSTREVYRWLAGRLGERILVDKTPSYAIDPATLEHAEEIFESPLYIHLVRHPAATIRSFIEAKLDQLLRRQGEGMTRRELGESHWLVCHRNILRFLSGVAPERQHRLYFEELVTDPRPVLEKLCHFLGLPYTAAMEDPYENTSARMSDGVRPESRMLGDVKFHSHGKIDPAAARRSARHVVGEIGEPAGRLCRRFGYLADEGELAHQRLLPISYQQRRLWTMHRRAPGSCAAFNVPAPFEVKGHLDQAALEQALGELVRRHEVLRTAYPEHRGEGVQTVHIDVEVHWNIVALSAVDAEHRRAAAVAVMEREMRRAFDLENEIPARFVCFELGPLHHILFFLLHHIYADGWAQGILLRELSALYRSFSSGQTPALPDPPMQYADFAMEQVDWLASAEGRSGLTYWRDRLRGLEPTRLPADRPRPAVQSFRGLTRYFDIEAETSAAFLRLAHERDASFFMVVLTAFMAFLSRVSGQFDLGVCVPILNRNRPELTELPGFFNNLLVMRADLAPAPGIGALHFGEALERVKQSAHEAYAHQEMPFHRVAEAVLAERGLTDMPADRHPINEISLSTAGIGRSAFDFPGLEANSVDLASRSAKFDLKLWVAESENRLEAALVYNIDIFDPTTGHRFAYHLERLFQAIAAAPFRPLHSLPYLTRGEEHQLLVEWNDRFEESGLGVHVLDAELFPVACGAPGELFLAVPLGAGYPNAPRRTARRFIPNPLHGASGQRLYRTGRWARFRSDGTLEIVAHPGS